MQSTAYGILDDFIHYLPSTHWAGMGLKKNFELKRRNLFCFEEHTSVIIKNFKTEKSNGGFLRKSKKSPRKWPFFENLTKIYF